MRKYVTIQGDTWDSVAYIALGSTEYTDQLMNANLQYHNVFIFSAGVTLTLPDISNTTQSQSVPWR